MLLQGSYVRAGRQVKAVPAFHWCEAMDDPPAKAALVPLAKQTDVRNCDNARNRLATMIGMTSRWA